MNRTSMGTLIFLLFFLFFFQSTSSQSLPPKREFRAAWVATVNNIDFPDKGTTNSLAQQRTWKELLDYYKKIGLNTVIFQVRPVADAFYNSSLEPWSAYLTGQQGQAPNPYYDPLDFMIKECHARNIEFHAWINPYRATMDLNTAQLSPKHPLKKHPDWFLQYGNRYYFNPSKVNVRAHINAVISEIVEKYDIDGIHFDDYFYPYPIEGEKFPDSLDFNLDKNGFYTIEDWRRNNVDLLIEEVSENIKELKPHIQFGISPFGVWRNKKDDSIHGSDTQAGVTSYDFLYADVLKWLQKGWIDYVVPQIYWHIGFPAADYEVLAQWWNKHAYGKNLYIGHAAYKVGTDKHEAWHQAEELERQIRLNRQLKTIQGSVYFSTRSLKKNPLNISESISKQYEYPSLHPISKFDDIAFPQAPKLKKLKRKGNRIRIKWKTKNKKTKPYYFVVYRFLGRTVGSFENPKSIWQITPFNSSNKITLYDTQYKRKQPYTFVITALDRYHRESKSSNSKTIEVR